MTRHARFARKDSNHGDIVKVLRQCGCTVFDASHVGDGFPDLVVFFRRQVILLEVKAGPQACLTPAEKEFHARWQGGPIYIVASVADVVSVLNSIE